MKQMHVNNRNDFAYLLSNLGLNGSAIEIGVAEGGFSFYLLDRWKGKCYQVDSWTNLSQAEYQDYCNVGDTEQDRRYALVLETAKKYKGRAIPMKMFSSDAVKQFEDNTFDFVYIDANHKYEFIKEDIKQWYPKCKSGGIFAGHDYLDGVITSGDYGVKSAVNEFCAETGLNVNVTNESDYPSWWVRKP